MTLLPDPFAISSHRVGWIMCPYCTVLHDAATGLKDQPHPADGDCNVCGKCFQVSIYDSSAPNGLRLPTIEEREEVMADSEVRRAISVARSSRHIIRRTRSVSN